MYSIIVFIYFLTIHHYMLILIFQFDMVDAENEVVVGTKSVGCWVSYGEDVWIRRSSYFGADDLRGVTYKKNETPKFYHLYR